MRDQIIEAVPRTTEQVHARQILLYNSDQANQVLAQLEAGNDFGNLAKKYDPITGGDLGWFSRNYLPEPRIEEIAFKLQPNEYSPVIESLAGFHIIQVLERDPQRPLSPDALLVLQAKALQDWLHARLGEAVIEILSISP
jgi:parvulin-like peptidyl-prolyl isomerase